MPGYDTTPENVQAFLKRVTGGTSAQPQTTDFNVANCGKVIIVIWPSCL